MAGYYLQIIVPRAILDSARETSCGIHADHISICKYSSSDSLGLSKFKLSILFPHQTPCYCTATSLGHSRLVLLFWKEQGAWLDLLSDAIMNIMILRNLLRERPGFGGTNNLNWWKKWKV